MSVKTLNLTPALYQYLCDISVTETEVQQQLREQTATMQAAAMISSPEQFQLTSLLLKMLNAKKVLEVGTFTGYSSLGFAVAMGLDGKIITCDNSEEFTNIAKQYWQQAQVSEQIELLLGDAVSSLQQLVADGHENSFDFMFIDAAKSQYDAYYENGLKLVRAGGLIAIDNVLWSGKVADKAVQDNQTKALRDLNHKIHNDSRVFASVVPIGDGLTLALKL